MTDFDYMSASVTDLENRLRDLNLPTEVTLSEAVTYQFKPTTGMESDVTEITPELRRLALIGRVVTNKINKETEPPLFVQSWASSKGLGRIAESSLAADALVNHIEPLLNRFVRWSYRTAQLNLSYLGKSLNVILSSSPPAFLSTVRHILGGVGVARGGAVVVDLPEDAVIDTSVEGCDCIVGAVPFLSKGYISLIVRVDDASWCYITVGNRSLGEGHRMPTFLEAAEDGTDLWGSTALLRKNNSTLLWRAMQLPMRSLGLHLSNKGICYRDKISMQGYEDSIMLPVELGSDNLHEMMRQQPSTFNSSNWIPAPPDIPTNSLGHYVRVHTISNRMMRPCTLLLDENMEYYGPEEFRSDPVTSLFVVYAQVNKDVLTLPESRFYKGTTKSTLSAYLDHYLKHPINRAEFDISLRLQLRRLRDLLGRDTSEDELRDTLVSKSLLETFAAYQG